MNAKEEFRRAWSIIRYEQADQSSDYAPYQFKIRDIYQEIRTISAVALGTAYRCHYLMNIQDRLDDPNRYGRNFRAKQDAIRHFVRIGSCSVNDVVAISKTEYERLRQIVRRAIE